MSRKKKKPPVVICPYCNKQTDLVDDTEIYRVSYGRKIYLCRKCTAYVGCHKGTIQPLGTPGKKELLKMRHHCHLLFDRIWRAAVAQRGWTISKARKSAYRWLADGLGIDVKECHFGMFDEVRTNEALQFLRRYYEGIQGKSYDNQHERINQD